jgi:uncharacterized membrane protein YidH (DUF202 family)
MNEVNEQEVLAKIRTLLALERNFLADERTALAEFRTGLAITLIGPTVSTLIAYVLSVFTVDQTVVLVVLNFTFFSVLIIFGVWTIFRSQSKLKIIRRKKMAIKKRRIEISKSSKGIYDLLFDYVEEDELQKDKM